VSYPGRSAGRPKGLRAERSALSDRQKSAEGIVGPAQATLVRHPRAERRGNRGAEPPRGGAEGPNGAPRGAHPWGPEPPLSARRAGPGVGTPRDATPARGGVPAALQGRWRRLVPAPRRRGALPAGRGPAAGERCLGPRAEPHAPRGVRAVCRAPGAGARETAGDVRVAGPDPRPHAPPPGTPHGGMEDRPDAPAAQAGEPASAAAASAPRAAQRPRRPAQPRPAWPLGR
jgi:hypothetical protein